MLCFLLLTTATTLAANNTQTKQFLSLADIHFDPFLSCKAKPCPLIQKLCEAPADQWSAIFSQLNSSSFEYGKDSNYFLLESSLAAAKTAALKAHAAFVLVIGDFLAHDFNGKYKKYAHDKTKTGYIAFVKKTLQFLTLELQHNFPQTDVYLAVGNNDSYEEDYVVEPQGSFFKDLGKLEASLIKEPKIKTVLLKQLSRDGYYALSVPETPQLRLIVLNSVLFSTKAKGPGLDQAAAEELAWLEQELQLATHKKQQVLIAMHIPTSFDIYKFHYSPFKINFWKTSYSQQFLAEIQRAAGSIMAVLPAHIHIDNFQILVIGNKAIPFSGTPSISPIFGNHPAFKVYSYALPALQLQDIASYYFLNTDNNWERKSNVEAKH
jgi:hypothetical protein